MQAIPADPAPLTTSLVSLVVRPVRSSALMKPAAAMMAVPLIVVKHRDIHNFPKLADKKAFRP